MKHSLISKFSIVLGGIVSSCIISSCKGNNETIMEKECFYTVSGNPYLPLWEHLPDGEPRVFEDPDNPGKFRVYVYGSHDVIYNGYCGFDIRAWSAPVEDLTQWKDEGAIFTYNNGDEWDIMYAPDLVELKHKDGRKEYYLYPNCRGRNREGMVAKGSRPDGPFVPINLSSDGKKLMDGSIIDFDPAAYIEYVNDENDPDYATGFRAYAYWGFQKSHATRLDPSTMYSVMPGHKAIEFFIPAANSYGDIKDPSGTEYNNVFPGENLNEFNFFEASSLRKVGNKYVFIYSGYSGPEYGISSSNSTLRYAYGDTPLGPWKIGGVLVDNRAPVLTCDGKNITTSSPGHNTHGSIEMINDQWYVFYHRAPRGFGYSRQPMVAPILVEYDEKPVSEGGKVVITGFDPYLDGNMLTLKDADGNEYKGAEVTSEGFNIFGLDPYKYYSAGYACYFSNNQVLQDSWDIWDNNMVVENVEDGNIVGFKYFGFGGLSRNIKGLKPFKGTQKGSHTNINVFIKPKTKESFKINVWLDGPWDNDVWKGQKMGEIFIEPDSKQEITKFKLDVSKFVDGLEGKHAVYLVAEGKGSEPLYDFIGIGFSSKQHEIEYPSVPVVEIKIDGKVVSTPLKPERADKLNGLTDYSIYRLEYETKGIGNIPMVTASCSNDKVEIDIKQANSMSDEAVVTSNYMGVEKIFIIKFINDLQD